MLFYHIFIIVIVYLIVRSYLRKENLICGQLVLSLRTEAKAVLENDIKRCLLSFYESYLFVYDKSKTIPNDDKFLEFRSSFIIFFRYTIGNKQCQIYDEIFGGKLYFDYYLNSEFEKYFKFIFISKLIKMTVNDE